MINRDSVTTECHDASHRDDRGSAGELASARWDDAPSRRNTHCPPDPQDDAGEHATRHAHRDAEGHAQGNAQGHAKRNAKAGERYVKLWRTVSRNLVFEFVGIEVTVGKILKSSIWVCLSGSDIPQTFVLPESQSVVPSNKTELREKTNGKEKLLD